jgi:hypothetical protein
VFGNIIGQDCLFISQLFFLQHNKNSIEYIEINAPYLKLYSILFDLYVIIKHGTVSKLITLSVVFYPVNYS